MKFLLELVACCGSSSEEERRLPEDARLLVARRGGREWRPSLSSISEDVLTARRINSSNVQQPAKGWHRSLKRKVAAIPQRDRRRSPAHDDFRLESMNEFIPDEVVVTCPMNFDMVMLEDNKTNDGGDQPMDSGDHPMESGGDAPQVPVEKKMTDALLDVDITMLEVMERVDEDSLLFHANGSHLGTMLLVSRWLSMEPNEEYYWTKQSGIFDLGGNISQSSDWKKLGLLLDYGLKRFGLSVHDISIQMCMDLSILTFWI
ncbi:hypothetical protein SASPL_154368 [Salvia splendens]|uniref:Uncharacterized protein n=1 Tax=Salvia splendens TaxID=180675 RepID=A0A8X8YZS0_SALSN|nr:hypothetical protein SASPL_154368 [Salvia splendens]